MDATKLIAMIAGLILVLLLWHLLTGRIPILSTTDYEKFNSLEQFHMEYEMGYYD